MECCKSIHELGEFMENGINIDPISLTMEEFNSAGISDEDEVSYLCQRTRPSLWFIATLRVSKE